MKLVLDLQTKVQGLIGNEVATARKGLDDQLGQLAALNMPSAPAAVATREMVARQLPLLAKAQTECQTKVATETDKLLARMKTWGRDVPDREKRAETRMKQLEDKLTAAVTKFLNSNKKSMNERKQKFDVMHEAATEKEAPVSLGASGANPSASPSASLSASPGIGSTGVGTNDSEGASG